MLLRRLRIWFARGTQLQASMEQDLYVEQQVPSGLLTGVHFNFLTEADIEKMSVLQIAAANEVTDTRLGLPNPLSECFSCGVRDTKNCEGHCGYIEFPITILHPQRISEVAHILNQFCPACKSNRQNLWVKGGDPISKHNRSMGCKYCAGNGNAKDWGYPTPKFKVSTKELFKKTAIIAEVSESKKLRNKSSRGVLPSDYWNFIPKDPQEENSSRPNIRVLSHAQVHHLLKGIDLRFIKEFVSQPETLFLNRFPVIPNSHRLTEVTHAFSNGQQVIFDERTRAYRKLVDFRGSANELSSRVLDCLKMSKLSSEKSTEKESASAYGLKFIKEVLLGKRNSNAFRMVVVGDPNIKLTEIGIPCHIAERLQISDHLNSFNWEKLNSVCNLRLLEKGEVYVRRKGSLVCVRRMNEFHIGDTLYRPLDDGDVILINRPPSIHHHSLIALSVKILPVNSVISINPLCCSPLCGDFDGDCLHGYVPQSFDSRAELRELVDLKKQLFNGQNGRNLLSLSQDSLTAAYLITEDGNFLNKFQIQQLEMFCPYKPQTPAIIKAPLQNTSLWTGKQLFSMLLPSGFDYVLPHNGVYVSNGELLSSFDNSSWLRNTDENLFYHLISSCKSNAIDVLSAAQEVLCEWLSMRGLTVSLLDIYISSSSHNRKNMLDEVICGLKEAQQACLIKQLMVDYHSIIRIAEEDKSHLIIEEDRLSDERQKSTALTQTSVSTFKHVFRDIQNLAFQYVGKDNSLMIMLKAGSKGSLIRLVQQGMCLGLQQSLVTLSFKIPHQLSCAAWNNQKENVENSSYIPYAVVQNSFLSGLNPVECFVHSLTSRDSSFSGNADLPGTLTRKLMFFMRDLYIAYDGTVRNTYGNQLVQFSYDIGKEVAVSPSSSVDEKDYGCDAMGGQPVGSLSACAISEAAYSALDLPVSTLEESPLLNLKRVFECGLKNRSATGQTVSLYLSKRIGKRRHGFEYGALEVKNQLERLLFSDIVWTTLIHFSLESGNGLNICPWACHFHVPKETVKRKRLKVRAIIDALYMRCNSAKVESKIRLPNLQISSKNCLVDESQKGKTVCIMVTIIESSKNSSISLDTVRDLLIPVLLGTVVKGFSEIRKVDILWNDHWNMPKSRNGFPGELYLRVHMSDLCSRTKFWSVLMSCCVKLMDVIDWERSHPDDIHDIFLAYGVDAAWKYFIINLKSATSDIGKTVLTKHMRLVADCLSCTGEFVSLSAKGMSRQREQASITSPFMQACFSSPGASFIKAAKVGAMDDLKGSLDALSWGKVPPIGTAGQFELLYSGKGHEICKPAEVYNLLGSQIRSHKQNVKTKTDAYSHNSDKCTVGIVYPASKGLKKLEIISKSVLKSCFSFNDIQKLSHTLKVILNKYPINHRLSDVDKSTLMMALYFHPRRDEKLGSGAQYIKVGYHTKYDNSRCFLLERTDGTVEDFSYHKCVYGALEVIAPGRAKSYYSKWLESAAD